jgi:hypothetical protein
MINAYNNGRLSSEHYLNLKNEISNAYQKIFNKEIESVIGRNPVAISKIRNEISAAYSDGKIIELHYNLLNEKISNMLNNEMSSG